MAFAKYVNTQILITHSSVRIVMAAESYDRSMLGHRFRIPLAPIAASASHVRHQSLARPNASLLYYALKRGCSSSILTVNLSSVLDPPPRLVRNSAPAFIGTGTSGSHNGCG